MQPERQRTTTGNLPTFDHVAHATSQRRTFSAHRMPPCRWICLCTMGWHEVLAGKPLLLARVRCASWVAHLSRAASGIPMADKHSSVNHRRRAGRPPAGAKEGEKVKDYPQLSIRVPI